MRTQKRILAVLLAVAVASAFGTGIAPAAGLAAPVFGETIAVQYPVAPRDVAVADFNGDGYDDVVSSVVGAEAQPAGVSLSLGGADPILAAPVMIEVGAPTWSVVANDFDADGNMDIAASLSVDPCIAVLFGHGDGTFSEPIIYLTGHLVRDLELADLNADGWMDIVGTQPELPGVVVLSGDNGGFSVSEYQVPDAGNVLEAASGQLVGDELPDIALADKDGARVLVLENTGAGFSVAQVLATGGQPLDVAVADLNSDGYDDVAASSSTASDVEIFLADGTGAFAGAVAVSTGTDAQAGAMAARDLDLDGDLDLLVANGSGSLVAFDNDGSGQFSLIESASVGSNPTAIAFGDPGNDGTLDIIVAGSGGVDAIPSLQTMMPMLFSLPPVPVPNTLDSIDVMGATRYETAIEASKLAFPNGANSLVVASGENWPDAVTASALAGRLQAPLLLTRGDALPTAVAEEVWRLGSSTAVVIGGEGAVSEAVVTALKALVGTGEVRRLAGATRYETADAVAHEVVAIAGSEFDGIAFVATGGTFADALAASPLAYAAGRPVYLTPAEGRSALVGEMVGDGVTDAIILGGTSAVGSAVELELVSTFGTGRVSRIAGVNRYDTAAAVAEYGVSQDGLSWDGVGLATGADFPDALTGGAMLGSRGSVMLLTRANQLPEAALNALSHHSAEVNTIIFLGGQASVGDVTRVAAYGALR
ncbi:MAG: cell wall-binding repeat-containing protein [Actinomycetota bacterium]|nr:cell wall-binding repeat-containing protein [Actinomycetota bacterium]